MDKNNRDSFLKNLASKYGRELRTKAEPFSESDWVNDYPATRLTELNRQDLVKNYIDFSKSLGINVQVCKEVDSAKTLLKVLEGYKGGPVIFNDDQRIHNLGSVEAVKEVYGADNVWVWDGSKGKEANMNFAAKSNVGVAFAENGLTEVGGIVLESGANCGRSVSLLPKYSVVFVKSSTVVPRVHQYAVKADQRAAEGKRQPSCINVICGPSSTADIELVKVVGVHGPVEVCYIIIDDENICPQEYFAKL